MRLMTLLILSSQFLGCASFSMGKSRCDAPEIPTRPKVFVLLARPGSTGIFADQIVDIENYVCMSGDDSKAKEVWIRDTLRACGQ
jgi:hypothetical protein